MKRSTDRILTTHPGRLPNPDNQDEIIQTRNSGDQQKLDELVRDGVAAMVRRQRDAGIDIMSDGEFWKFRDQTYYGSRASGIETRPIKPGEPPTILVFQEERRTPEFKMFWEIYDRTGNTPMPGVEIRGMGLQTQRSAITGPLT